MVKVHRLTGRHIEEVKLTAYVRRLDKIYTDLEKPEMLPKVVKKMRERYAENPHSFYLLVCRKYGLKPLDELKDNDVYAMVYGKTMFNKVKAVEDEEAEIEAAKITKEIIETKLKDLESEEESGSVTSDSDSKSATKSESKEKESEMWPSKNRYTPRMKIDIPDRADRYSYKMPERQRSLPRKEFGLNSPRAHYQYKRHKQAPVDHLDYVDVHPGDIVETMVLTGEQGDDHTGFWIPARILSIDEKNQMMDLQVLNPRKYGLAARAVKVPLKYVRAPTNIQWRN
jgi:hypothetical protein